MSDAQTVRLVHAHGIPNQYVANQLYQPNDEDRRSRGSFFILIHQTDTSDGAFVSSLISALIRDYYHPGSPTGIDGVEHSLVRVNELIKNSTVQNTIHGVICLLFEDEIHVSYIGAGHVFLARAGEVLTLTEDVKSNPQATFSVITSGEIHPSDTLLIFTGLDQDDATMKQSFLFAIGHQPLYESGRALARLFQQSGFREAEAQVISFGSIGNDTIAVDKSLETGEEKLARFKTQATGVVAKFGPIVMRLRGRFAKDISQNQAEGEPATNVSSDEMSDGPQSEFTIKTYKQPLKTLLANPDPPTEAKPAPPVSMASVFRRLNPRIGMLFAGIAVMLIIIIGVFNRLSRPPQPSTAQRDALVAEAEQVAREVDTAQVEDNREKAIEKLLQTQVVLAKIPENLRNEKSRALDRRSTELVAKLTNSRQLTVTTTVTATQQPSRVISGATRSYVFGASGVQALRDTTLTSVAITAPIIDAVPFAAGKKIAFLTKANDVVKLAQIDDTSLEPRELTRTDSKPWPESKLIASFESNLYVIGSKVTKAIPSGDKYQVVTYQSDAPTSDMTTFINNGTVFYGIEGDRQIMRVAANSPKTPIKLFGVPESFWPLKINRLVSTGLEGQLYLLDLEGKRIIVISTDGGYKGQYRLENDGLLVDCSATAGSFVCVSADKKIKTYTIAL